MLSLIIAAAAQTCPSVGTGWTSTTLDSNISYVAHHRVEGTTLNLRLTAASTGWLGFGFAEGSTGHMKGSDMVTVNVVNGQVYVDDRYADFAASTYTAAAGAGYVGLTALVDTHQDWTIVSGSESGGNMEVWLTRELNTTDSQDRAVNTEGSTRITWAWGASDSVR